MPDCDYYVKNRFGRYDDISEDEESIRKKLAKAEVLKITGIAKLKENSENMLMTSPIGYTKLLTDYIIEYTDNSSVVKAQRADENVNAITGMAFEPKDDSENGLDLLSYKAKSAKRSFRILTTISSLTPETFSSIIASRSKILLSKKS